jgi:hypothetical protein
MSLGDKLKQYGNLFIAVLITVGFGATFLVYGGGGAGGSGPSQNQNQEQRNFTAPSQQFSETGFNRSYIEQTVIAARQEAVFVNAVYDNESQIEELGQVRQIQERYGEKTFVQIVSSTQVPEIVSRNGITEFPAVAVQGGIITQRGPAPQQESVTNITVRNIEEAVCNTLNNLGSAAARCQQIGVL